MSASPQFDFEKITLGDYFAIQAAMMMGKLGLSQLSFPVLFPIISKVAGVEIENLPICEAMTVIEQFADAMQREVESPDGVLHKLAEYGSDDD